MSIMHVVGRIHPFWLCHFVKHHLLEPNTIYTLLYVFGSYAHHPAWFDISTQLAQVNIFIIPIINISNNSSFCQKHPGVPFGANSPDRTSYPQTQEYTLPVAQARGLVVYVTSLLYAQIRAIRTIRVLHSSQWAQLCCSHLPNAWRCLCHFLAKCHIWPLRYYYISDAALSQYMFGFEMLSLITIQSSLGIHCLPLHLLRHYRILQVWNILSNLHTL